MVKIHVKRGDDSQFLYETTVSISVEQLQIALVRIFNGRLKVDRLSQEIELLSSHGIMLPPNMQGLTEDQITDLKLTDQFADTCIPSGGFIENPDPTGRRNGRAPNEKMKEILRRTVSEAKSTVSKVTADICLTDDMISDSLEKLRGAVMIVYPMNLPPYDPIINEFEGTEDLAGTQASLEVLDETSTQVWWAGKQLQGGKTLSEYIGKNEKTKIVAKLQKKGQGAPSREQVFSEDEKKKMMQHAYRRQEELKKLNIDDEDTYMSNRWADPNSLQRSFQGLDNIGWRPK